MTQAHKYKILLQRFLYACVNALVGTMQASCLSHSSAIAKTALQNSLLTEVEW